MKKSFIFIIVSAVLILSCINTASARRVFVPPQYVDGLGYVPGHWVTVPDDYPNGCNSGLLDALIQQRQMDRQAAKDFANNLESLARRIRMKKLWHWFMEWGDYSPSGLRNFARRYNASMDEMTALMNAKRQLGW